MSIVVRLPLVLSVKDDANVMIRQFRGECLPLFNQLRIETVFPVPFILSFRLCKGVEARFIGLFN